LDFIVKTEKERNFKAEKMCFTPQQNTSKKSNIKSEALKTRIGRKNKAENII